MKAIKENKKSRIPRHHFKSPKQKSHNEVKEIEKKKEEKKPAGRIDVESMQDILKDNPNAGFILGFSEMLNLANGYRMAKSRGTKLFYEFYPYMRYKFKELNTFSKVHLMGMTGTPMTNTNVRQLKLSNTDRFMIDKMVGYDIGPIDDLRIELGEDGLPKGLEGINKTIAKKLAHIKMSNEETGAYNSAVENFKSEFLKYLSIVDEVKIAKKGFDLTDPARCKKYFSAMVEARENGWYDLPDPSSEEIAWVKKNMPDKISAYKGFVKSDKQDDIKPAAISMSDIELLMGGIGEGIEDAGFSLKDIGKFFGDTFATARSSIVTGVVDIIIGVLKSLILNNSEKVNEIVGCVPSVITIDKSIEEVNGLSDLIRNIVSDIADFKEAQTDDDRLAIVDKLGDTIKKSKFVNSEEFGKILTKSASKKEKKQKEVDNAASAISDIVKNIAEHLSTSELQPNGGKDITSSLVVVTDPKDVHVPKDKKGDQKKVENAAMGMSPQAAFPNMMTPELMSEFQIDSDTPSFLNPSVQVSREQREKPAFILEANMTNPGSQMPPAQPQVRHLIKNEVLANYPFCKDIADIASKYGVSLSMHPGYYPGENQTLRMISIQVVAAVNGVYSPTKSFTIDLGQCLDTRIKLFFNAKASGFEYMEACSEAFNLFDNKTNQLLAPFFEKVFQMGYEGLREEDKRPYRMYNSNTMQLNRVILYISLPTGAVRGEERQALKDSAFKMMGQIKEINRLNGINLGRFYVKEFEKENLSYVLTNEESYLYGVPNSAPRFEILVVIQKDKNGKIKKDKNGKQPEIIYSVRYADNVFPNGFKFPDSANTIEIVDSKDIKDKEVEEAEVVELNSPEVDPGNGGEVTTTTSK